MRVRFPLAVVVLAAALAAAGRSAAQSLTCLSVSSTGARGDGISLVPVLTPDGRFIAFDSRATNLVPGDTNGFWDVFVHDQTTGETTRVSVNSAGGQANADCFSPTISADGRFVAFTGVASNLVAGDANGLWDVFVHDRATGETSRVSLGTAGTDGDGNSAEPSMSADGRFVTFRSDATNLVPGDGNAITDVFVRDRSTGVTTRASVDSAGVQANGGSDAAVISADGRSIAFRSVATNLVTGDTNGFTDVFVHDRETGATTRVSVATSGAQGDRSSVDPAISADGRFVAFDSDATSFVLGDADGDFDVYVHDRVTGTTELASADSAGVPGNAYSAVSAISADGRHVTFASEATNLVADDTNGVFDTFAHDRFSGVTTRVSVTLAGEQGNFASLFSAISADGSFVAFNSGATNLVPGDTNGELNDLFFLDRVVSRAGNVNGGVGQVTDVLFVNDSAGGAERLVRLSLHSPLTIFVAPPPSATEPAPFALYAWGVIPLTGAARFPLPFGIGESCLPMPLAGGTPAPLVVWNNTGAPRAGAPKFPSSPAPWIVLDRSTSFRRPVDAFVQGVIVDRGAPNGRAAVTNGVAIEVR